MGSCTNLIENVHAITTFLTASEYEKTDRGTILTNLSSIQSITNYEIDLKKKYRMYIQCETWS